jgi:hypothetical protein
LLKFTRAGDGIEVEEVYFLGPQLVVYAAGAWMSSFHAGGAAVEIPNNGPSARQADGSVDIIEGVRGFELVGNALCGVPAR